LYSHTLVGAVYSRYTADSSISSLHFGCAAENAKACRGISRALLIIHSFLTITNTIQSNLKTWHCPFIQSTIQMVHCDGVIYRLQFRNAKNFHTCRHLS